MSLLGASLMPCAVSPQSRHPVTGVWIEPLSNQLGFVLAAGEVKHGLASAASHVGGLDSSAIVDYLLPDNGSFRCVTVGVFSYRFNVRNGLVVLNDKHLLVIIPAYNEEESIESTVDELTAALPGIEYLVVNDGSKDGTERICQQRGYRYVSLPVNSGLTVGFQTGMKYALRNGYDYAIQFDADGQHCPKFIPQMLECAESENADIVIGSRFVEKCKEVSARMIGSRVITVAIKLTTGKRVSDPTSGMRLFNRAMIKRFATDDSLNPEPESISLLIRKGAKVREVQVEMRERQAGESYLNIPKSIAYMARACISILFVQWFR